MTLCIAGCAREKTSSGDGATAPSASASAASSAGGAAKAAFWSANPRPASTNDPKPWANEGGRQGKCTFTGWATVDGEKRSMFHVEGPPGREADTLQTWQYYYDADGKQLDEYPSATDAAMNDDAGVQSLGRAGASIKKEFATVECEVTSIHFKDGTSWWNENLMTGGLRRPRGGFSSAVLAEHTGERIIVGAIDPQQKKVELKNVGDRTTRSVRVETICWKKDDRNGDRDTVDVAIPAGESRTAKLDLSSSALEGCELLEAAVSRVEYADDTVWTNRNLESNERPR